MLKMSFKRIFIVLFMINLAFSDEFITNGDVEILSIDSDFAGELKVDDKKALWLTNPSNPNQKIAIIKANYRANSDIVVEHKFSGEVWQERFKIKKGDYKKEQITVSSSKVNPPKEVSERIKKEYEEANAIYAKTTPNLLFNSPFILPLNSHITSSFGNARLFNNSLKSYHSGTDFRAAIGTKISASNDGVVVIAKDRYYAGNSVVINHGGGIYSQYYHLSKLFVKVGDSVKKGDIIGLSGDTGRVSGAHLHYGIAINGVSVDPLSFTKKINFALFGE